MQFLEWHVPNSYNLVLFGDNQEGNVLQDKEAYLHTIDYILSHKNTYGLHMGDEMEALYIDDPRYDPNILTSPPITQQDTVVADLKKLAQKGKLITILYGNHTDRLFPKIGDITRSTCKKLGIPYGGFSSVVTFTGKDGPQFKGYFTHGRRLIRSVADDPVRRLANEQLQLKQQLKYKFGDCLLMAKGHCHKLIVCDPRTQLYLTTEPEIKENYTHNPPFGKGGYIHPDHRWYAATGSFLRTFGKDVNSYSEMGEYDPVEIGYILVQVEGREIINVKKVVL